MVLEALSDTTITAYSTRICRLRISEVGSGLPCVDQVATNAASSAAYTKSDPARLFDDLGSISIPRYCPMNDPDGDADSFKFTANLY